MSSVALGTGKPCDGAARLPAQCAPCQTLHPSSKARFRAWPEKRFEAKRSASRKRPARIEPTSPRSSGASKFSNRNCDVRARPARKLPQLPSTRRRLGHYASAQSRSPLSANGFSCRPRTMGSWLERLDSPCTTGKAARCVHAQRICRRSRRSRSLASERLRHGWRHCGNPNRSSSRLLRLVPQDRRRGVDAEGLLDNLSRIDGGLRDGPAKHLLDADEPVLSVQKDYREHFVCEGADLIDLRSVML